MMNLKKRTSVIAAAVVVVLVSAVAAYAYWTAGGTGSGTAATAAGTNGLTVNQAALATPLEPGVAAQTLSGTFGNTNKAPVYVTSVTAAITSVTPAQGLTCTAANYTLTDAVMTVGTTVAVGDPVGAWTGAKIQFNNTDANQDGCKGAVVNLGYTVI
jgi:hypothetical protein